METSKKYKIISDERISGSTRLICLLGSPVAHSLSPIMHNLSFAHEGLDFVYLAFDIKSEAIGKTLDSLKTLNFRGCNLTMPLKISCLPYIDELSKVSFLCKAVNTITFEDGKLYGTSTDGTGFYDSLLDHGFDVKNEKVTLLGAGGAATSIAAEMALRGVREIDIFQRKSKTFERAAEFSGRVNHETNCHVEVIDLEDKSSLKKAISESALLLNATNVGMGEDKNSLIPEEYLRQNLIVSDIIYHPEKTTLLKEAEKIGAPFFNGKDMLLFQGAASFEIWTGKKMPVSFIKEKHIFD